MSRLGAVLFDVDGVLLDSLPAHLKICEDLSREYGLNLKIPSQPEFKEKVRGGTRISPMEYFFLAVGFGSESAKKADVRYKETFHATYKPAPFPRVHETLKALHDDGIRMGIVTSNVKANVVAALGGSIDCFHADCIFSKDRTGDVPKSKAIASAMKVLQVSPAETIYVGDQRPDWQAAKDAGVDFLGVAYGWGLSDEDKDIPIVGEVSEIYRYISGRADSVT